MGMQCGAVRCDAVDAVGRVVARQEVLEDGRRKVKVHGGLVVDSRESQVPGASDWVLAPVEDVPTPRRMWRSDGGGQSQSQRHRPQVSPGPQASSGQLQQHDGDAVRIDVLAVDETALRRQFRTEKSTFFSSVSFTGDDR
ncbi:hypothetical protein CCHR01_09658 [Colletotrichum chrysophilum]|uniref:Uncharacterized protein n=1 Tax=Colletotrichum chrysophilum TaxID=1836956 RepID=A0AAD9AIR5_9PEZI|nr:hypothetical protein CCHR01_09658 [Colletotrichum chrysophilum]